jgi:osmoprotectant transport system ATP-binding protein
MDDADHGPDRTGQPMIRLDGVTKRYEDGTVAVSALSLDVARGELVALVGPSGCGKSTTLRMVNRLVEPTAGSIWLDGVDVTHADPVELRRKIGYVIQRVGLFPHLTVGANVACVPDLLGWDAGRTRRRVAELLELVGLEGDTYAKRYPHELSGGQQQRVGVARALAADPPVLLMDEPFGAVDPVARARLQSRFRAIQASLHKTVLFVTHDIEEAVRLADRVAVFSAGGLLEQVAPAAQLLAEPANDNVAAFVGAERGIRRLVVTPVDAGTLTRPTVVQAGASAPEQARLLAGDDVDWAVVLDDDGTLAGWVRTADLTTARTPADALRPAPPPLEAGASLHDALALLLTQDVPWVPVLEPGDGGPGTRRYLGVLTPSDVHGALRRAS